MQLNMGIIGAGGFAGFAVTEFLKNQNIKLKGIYDVNAEKADSFASKFICDTYNSPEELLHDEAVDLIYIATPPHLHYKQSKEALLNQKHVICEKPVSLNNQQAKELDRLATERGKLFVVNLMQPYNPLVQQVKTIMATRLMGKFLHGYFENYASDASLAPDHWLWNENISGGIFIEHGVHFFDLFSHWLGAGNVIFAFEQKRTGFENLTADRVQATVQYEEGTVNFYHGFDQPKVFDRQEFKLVFERGDITLNEWVPTTLKINALVTREELLKMESIVNPDKTEVIEHYAENTIFNARFKSFKADHHVSLISGLNHSKEKMYQMILGLFLEDQLRWISDKDHKRIVTAQNAVKSLEMAISAHELAT